MTPRNRSLAAALSAAAFSLFLLATPSAQAQSDDEMRERAREVLGREDLAVPPGREHRGREQRRSEPRGDNRGPERRIDSTPGRQHPGSIQRHLEPRGERGDHRGRDQRIASTPGREHPGSIRIGTDRGEHRGRGDQRRRNDFRDHDRNDGNPGYDRRDRRGHEYRGREHNRWNNRHHERRGYRHDRRDSRYAHNDRYDRYDRYGDHRRYRSSSRYHHRRYVGPRHHRSSWRYHRRYQDRYASVGFNYYDGFCRPQGEELIIGALLGALIGGAASEGDGGAILAGGLIGGGIGASLNSCDRSQYHYAAHHAFSNNQPGYWHNPHSGVYGVVYARDYHSYRGQRCRWGDAEVYMPNGEIAYDRVRMCLNRYGYWETARYQ